MAYVKDKFKIFFTNRIMSRFLILILLVNLVMGFLLYRFVDFSKDSYVLHYNNYFGIDLLGASSNLLYIVLGSLVLMILNIIIAFMVFAKKNNFFIPNIIMAASFFVDLEILFYLIKMINLEY